MNVQSIFKKAHATNHQIIITKNCYRPHSEGRWKVMFSQVFVCPWGWGREAHAIPIMRCNITHNAMGQEVPLVLSLVLSGVATPWPCLWSFLGEEVPPWSCLGISPFPFRTGGTPPILQGKDSGYLLPSPQTGQGYPSRPRKDRGTPGQDKGYPSPSTGQGNIPRTGYAAGGAALVVTQEDFLVTGEIGKAQKICTSRQVD